MSWNAGRPVANSASLTSNRIKRMTTSGSLPLVGSVVLCTFLCHVVTGVRDVWCRWNTSCLLEASFPIGDDVVIHWIQQSRGDAQVHAFYYNADQLNNQEKRFKDRTSLFKENISKGNASLLLKDVVVGDGGRYKCYVGTLTDTTESFINLHVEAPVTTIHFHQEDKQQLVCSSDRIFPEPQLHWSTEPVLPHALVNTSQVQQDVQTQLYNVSGTLDLAGEPDLDVDYVCDVRGVNSSSRFTWRKTSVNTSDTDTTIECAPVTHQRRVAWTFNRSHDIVSRRVGHKLHIADDWRKHVRGLSEAGGLKLQELSGHQSGTYTCTLSNTTHTRVNHVFLRVVGTEDGGDRSTRRRPTRARGEHANSTQEGPSLDSNRRPKNWEADVLTTRLPCRPSEH
ncbi:uncharacterized protein LOC144009288 isoform X2 [Festucalex cinctus]